MISATTESGPRRAQVVGTGLIGGSVGLGLRRLGWHVTGDDVDPGRAERAAELGCLDATGVDAAAELTFLAVPVGSVVDAARDALARGGVVTDVGSVKSPVVDALDDPRFVGGHPMAGSEALGVDGARADLFAGAVWVLTPTTATDSSALAMVHSVVRQLGAEVLTLAPGDHDALVATVSHVPHLTAASLMGLASERSTEHQALLRLAAGGFRDMTRIAAGDPRIWLDICQDNRGAILDVLDDLIGSLGEMRSVIDRGDTDELDQRLRAAQVARRSLPTGAPPAEELSELRVSIPDRKGELAAITALATELSVNIHDIEVAHSVSERGGLLILVVDSDRAEQLAEAIQSQVVDRTVSIHELA